MPAIRVTGLVKRFGDACALDNVDLVVANNEVHGLLGPNGAGKTTLLRILFGLVRADAGEVELLGRSQHVPAGVSLDGVAGFVEDPRFYPYLSAQTNLELLAALDAHRSVERVGDVLDRVGLSRHHRDRVGGFSTGMRQRLGIAAALLREPQLLLFDEPTSGLDPAGSRDVRALIRDLAADRVAVLMSSHQIGEVEDICHGFTVLRRGAVVWTGSATELRDQAPASAYRLVTTDDQRALSLADAVAGLRATRSQRGDVVVSAADAVLDSFVLLLGRSDIAVRRLELLVSPLESMFFALTRDDDTESFTFDEFAEHALAAQ